MNPFYKVQSYSKLIHGVRDQDSIYFGGGQKDSNKKET